MSETQFKRLQATIILAALISNYSIPRKDNGDIDWQMVSDTFMPAAQTLEDMITKMYSFKWGDSIKRTND
jgi:hypothetical protein